MEILMFGHYHIVLEMHIMWFMWFNYRKYKSQVLCKFKVMVLCKMICLGHESGDF